METGNRTGRNARRDARLVETPALPRSGFRARVFRRRTPSGMNRFTLDCVEVDSPMTADILRANIERSIEVHSLLMAACLPALTAAADALVTAYRAGHKALFFGNGGSAADAQHLA